MVRAEAFEQAVEALAEVPTGTNRLSTNDFDQEDGVTDERTLVASHQFNRPIAIKDGEVLDIDFLAYESFETDNTADNEETFNLGHDVIDSPSVPQDFILYNGGSRVASGDVSVDYGADTFDYTDSGTENTLHAFYVAGDQATLEVRKTAPNGTHETLDEYDLSLVNRRNQNKEPIRFDADHQLQGVIPTDWTLDFYIDAPYVVSWGIDVDDDGEDEATPTQQILSFPIRRSEQNIPSDVETVIREVAAVQ